jgi:hypothetical protein
MVKDKKNIMLTKKELVLLIQGTIGIVILFIIEPQNWWRFAIFNYCVAFVFEASMEALYTYSDDLKTARCIPKTDVNYLFALNWNFLFVVISLAGRFFGNTYVFFLLYGFIFGNLMEILYHKLGYWVYNYDIKYMGLYYPFRPRLSILGVPAQIIIAYPFLIGSFVWFTSHLVFK